MVLREFQDGGRMSVGRLKEDLSTDTTFDPPKISLDSPFNRLSFHLHWTFASDVINLHLNIEIFMKSYRSRKLTL